MKRTEPMCVADILRLTLEENRMERKLREYSAIRLWSSLVGENIAEMCDKPCVCKGVMTIKVSNAALRHELSMSRTIIIRNINKMLGDDIISEIRYTG